MSKKRAKRSRSNNPEGRPKEYQENLRTISVSLPESIIQRLDDISAEVGSSRQRLLIEWLKIALALDASRFMWSSAAGTFFEQFPTQPSLVEGETNTPFTNREAAEWYAKLAETSPDSFIGGRSYLCFRDQMQEKLMLDQWQLESEQRRKETNPEPS